MVDKSVYTLRGWLAFVAFLDFAQTLRSGIDKDVFLGSYMCKNSSAFNCSDVTGREPVPPSSARLLIAYSAQNGIILLICAVCIHHWSTIIMAAISLLMKIAYLFLEAIKFKSAPFNFHIIFPVVVHGITFVILLFSPKILYKKELNHEQENEEILKMCNGRPSPMFIQLKKPKKKVPEKSKDD